MILITGDKGREDAMNLHKALAEGDRNTGVLRVRVFWPVPPVQGAPGVPPQVFVDNSMSLNPDAFGKNGSHSRISTQTATGAVFHPGIPPPRFRGGYSAETDALTAPLRAQDARPPRAEAVVYFQICM